MYSFIIWSGTMGFAITILKAINKFNFIFISLVTSALDFIAGIKWYKLALSTWDYKSFMNFLKLYIFWAVMGDFSTLHCVKYDFFIISNTWTELILFLLKFESIACRLIQPSNGFFFWFPLGLSLSKDCEWHLIHFLIRIPLCLLNSTGI